MSNFQQQINAAITNLRKQKQMSQEKFSEKCGISSDSYRNLEYNRYTPKASTIDKICNAFNITPIELLSLGISPPKTSSEITTSLNTLSDEQLSIVYDFIKMIKQHKC